MALADSVPGVSGGTVAFILGFYDEFINSLTVVVSLKDRIARRKAESFLKKLAFGWIIGMGLSVSFLADVFETNIYSISSLFLGFIVCSIPLVIKEERSVIKGKYQYLIFTLIGILAVTAVTYFNPVSINMSKEISINNSSLEFYIYLFIAGIITISAMVLPGISGSTLLLILGLYAPIISSINEIFNLDFTSLPVICIFMLGVLVGVFSTINLIKYLLKKYRGQVIYLIIGLMIGSIYAVFQGPTTLKIPQEAMNLGNFSIVYFCVGGILIFLLENISTVLQKR